MLVRLQFSGTETFLGCWVDIFNLSIILLALCLAINSSNLNVSYFHCLGVVTIILNLSLFLYHPIPIKDTEEGFFILTFLYLCITACHPSFFLWLCLSHEVIHTFYNSPRVSSPPIIQSSVIIITDHPSLIQPFLHLYRLSSAEVVYGCLTLQYAVY